MNLRSEVWIRVEYLVGREELSFRLIGSREGGKDLRCKIVGGGERDLLDTREGHAEVGIRFVRIWYLDNACVVGHPEK